VTWTQIGQSHTDGNQGLTLEALPGGQLVAYNSGSDALRGSNDGGATWVALGDVDPSRTDIVRLHDVEMGPDGHLYAAMSAQAGAPYAGVYRTVSPYPVASEHTLPPVADDIGLRVEPNPSSGRATVRWQQATPGVARLAVLDARGREILSLPDRDGIAGAHSAEVDTSILPPGVYVVHVALPEGATATARLVVAR
jgi:hypothetical protein